MNQILSLRKKSDQLDKQIIFLLKKRKKIVFQIKKIKKEQGLPARDLKREAVILQRAGQFKKVFKAILER